MYKYSRLITRSAREGVPTGKFNFTSVTLASIVKGRKDPWHILG